MSITFRQYIANCIEEFWSADGVDEEICKHCRNHATCAELAKENKALPVSECKRSLGELLDSPIDSDPELFELLHEGFLEATEDME